MRPRTEIRNWRAYLVAGDYPKELKETAAKYNKKHDLSLYVLIVVSVVGIVPFVGAFAALIGIPAAFWLRRYEFRVVRRLVVRMNFHRMHQEWERTWQRDGLYQREDGSWVRPGWDPMPHP